MFHLAVKKYLERHGFEALRPKAVLFDMDGVLYDSMPNHAIAWQQSMAQFGIQMTADDAYATEGARGVDTIRKMVKRQQRRDIDEAEAQRMYDVKSHIFHSLPEAPIMPGVLDLMQQIQADGIQIGVVTGSGQRPLIQRILSDFENYVDEKHITTAYDVHRRGECAIRSACRCGCEDFYHCREYRSTTRTDTLRRECRPAIPHYEGIQRQLAQPFPVVSLFILDDIFLIIGNKERGHRQGDDHTENTHQRAPDGK